MSGQNRGISRASRPVGIALSGGLLATLCFCIALLGSSGGAWADPCVVPDDTTGTVSLPPVGCEYLSPDEVHLIMANLPAGTEIILDTIHLDFICKQGGGPHCGQPGGPLGGEQELFVSNARLHISGTGVLSGFSRTITVPMFCETATAPRNPGDAVQDFDTEMVQLQGSIAGDPDFQQLIITAGSANGLPSPGHTTLTRLGGPGSDFQVDSFFDVSYQIDFVGAPGSVLDGFSGSTTGILRMEARGPGACPPLADGSGCSTSPNCLSAEPCSPACVNFDPATGAVTVTDCQCRDPNTCQVDLSGARGVPNPCDVPEGPPGTVTLPPAGCEYLSPDEVHEIIDGLPAGTTIELAVIHKDFICQKTPGSCSIALPPGECEGAGGGLGGNVDCFQSTVELTVIGTGGLAGFNRTLSIPTECEIHTGPRTPGDPVQTFPSEMVFMQGEIFGDPDFCTFRLTAGTANGLASSGQTTLTDNGDGTFSVDSFFDITYQIDYVGCAGSVLAGLSGSAVGTLRMSTGTTGGQPGCIGGCPPGTSCVETVTPRADGTRDVCCDCIPDPPQCQPLADGSACEPFVCTDGVSNCNPSCITFDPATGQTTVDACDCADPTECHVEIPGPAGVPCATPRGGNRGPGNPCEVTPVGGTVELPPTNCSYQSPEDIHEIINGLPAGTTLEIGATHEKFFNETRTPGGTLGGEVEIFDSILQLQLCGTGALSGFTRTLFVPVACEVHTAPRTLFDPVQSFDTDMFRLQGQIVGDPDFALLKVTAGTAFGLPSPGHTTLTLIPSGNYVVDSFFNVAYQIEFIGAAGGPLAGFAGTTTATLRMGTGDMPRCEGGCPQGEICEETRIVNADGTISLCCKCVPEPLACLPTADGSACGNFNCPAPPLEECLPRCVNVDPVLGTTTVVDCDCRPPDECHVDLVPFVPGRGVPTDPCVVADVGGTVELPPVGCEYLSPEEVHEIIDNLPAGVTIELAAIHKDMVCSTNGVAQFPWCPPPGLCEDPADGNGSLGGRRDCFDSTLELSIDFKNNGIPFHHRDITISQVACAVHTAPRNVGAAVQDFDTVMFDLQGQLGGGDPDFASLVITAGNNSGLPSPGHTTLTQLPGGQFAVDSFFDITYRIDWVGTAAGVLNGASGSTTAIVRMRTGNIPDCDGSCPVGTICEKTVVVLADGTIDVCCDCVSPPPACTPTSDGSGCVPFVCTDGVSICSPSCATVDPLTGVVTVTACDCRGPNECQVDAGTSPSPRVETRGGGDPCVVPPGPVGTITLPPPGCDYLSPEEVHVILDGLPIGATIELAPIHKSFICEQGPAGGFPGCPPPNICEEPGGSLGGQVDCFQSTLEMQVTGTGPLAGFSRNLSIPIQCQVHTGPRTPGDAVQNFQTDMHFLQGELPSGDPDFCVLKITGGTGFGMPSPGETTLTELPSGNFAVDSFFDITYQIEYVGCPNGALANLSGTTIANLTMVTGSTPSCLGGCPAPEVCEEIQTVNADGTISVCCNCVAPPTCDPTTDGLGCQPFVCPDPAVEECQSVCVHFDAITGQTVVTDCECRNIGDCHVEMVPIGSGGGRGVPPSDSDGCVVPDTSGGGTINLPPDGCGYVSPDDFHLIVPDSVPAGTTIEVDASHHGFLCCDVTCPPPAPPPELCRQDPGRGGGVLCNDDCTSEVQPGGTLGGEIERFDSILTLSMNGTGDLAGFSTSIDIAVACEVHTALRTPGDPVQSFPTEMVQMVGALEPGDPDFCSLTIIAGSNFGLPPSTGQTRLVLLPSGDYNVDSHFDVAYQIDFVGCVGGALAGLTGSTTGTLRMQTGSGATEIPKCVGNCPVNTLCVESVTTFPDGSFDMCCNCVTVPVLTAVASCAVHDPNGIQGGAERLCMSIVAAAPRSGACDPRTDTTIEPRFYGIGGLTSPDFNEFDFVLAGPAAGAVTVDASCTDGNVYAASPVTVNTDGLTVTAIFDPALPNTHCCTLTLGGGASGSQVIKMLRGDVNGSTRVNATDKNIVKLKASTQTPPLVCDDFFYDVDMSGRINATDKNLVKARITTTPELNGLCP